MSALRALAPRRAAACALPRQQAFFHATRSPLRTFTSSFRATEKDPQLGDYPDFPAKSYQARRYNKSWWDPQEKRNFGEIPHEQDDILSVWAPDIHADVKPSFALRQLGIFILCFMTFVGVVYYFAPEMPAERRTYPRNGLAEELGNPQVAAYKQGDFDAPEGDDEEE